MPRLRPVAVALALAASTSPAAGAEVIAPGEETTLSVTYLGLTTGEGRIRVGLPEGDVLPITFEARSRGIIGFLDIREDLVSFWDRATRLPRGYELHAVELGDRHDDHTRYDRGAGTATVTESRKGRTKVKVIPVEPGTLDLTSVVPWLRGLPLAAGDRYEVPVLAGTDRFTLVARVDGRERVETDAGAFDTVRLKILTRLTGKFATERESTAWLSDDARRILVRFASDFAIGSVVATLKSWRPGDPVAAR